MRWLSRTRYDPIAALMSSDNEAIVFHVRRDLLGDKVGPVRRLWDLPDVRRRLRKQKPGGFFEYPGNRPHVYPEHHYPLLETWKQFRFLVEQYGFNKRHPAGREAAEFLFSCQTADGDIRGLIANQHATYYTGAIMALLIKAGYAHDPRIERGFKWLLSMRQDDGGWTVPLQTVELTPADIYRLTSEPADPVKLDRSKPFAHNCTGMVIRAFAAHPQRRRSAAARTAAKLLKTRFLKPDVYSSYKAAAYSDCRNTWRADCIGILGVRELGQRMDL